MYTLQVTADKLNIRSSPVAGTQANWVGDMNAGAIFKAVNKVKGALVDGSDDWYVDDMNRFVSAAWVNEITNDYNNRITNLPDNWKATRGKDIKVVIMDSGISNDHVDTKLKPENYFDFCDNSNNKFDEIGHGTKVAGIIGANVVSTTPKGITGIAPLCEMISYKITTDGVPEDAGIVKAIPQLVSLASQNKVIIVNCSWDVNQSVVLDNLFTSVPKNVIFICAAGNNNELLTQDAPFNYPARLDGMISVGFIRKDLFPSLIPANKLNPALDYIFIGSALKSCSIPGTSYGDFDKCSMSTSLMSGVIALLVSANIGEENIDVAFIKNKLNAQLPSLPANPGDGITLYKLKN